MKLPACFFLLVLLLVVSADAASKEENAAAAGMALVKELTSMSPSRGLTNTGVLIIRDKNHSSVEVPVSIVIQPHDLSWTTTYQTTSNDTNYAARLVIRQSVGQPNQYELTAGAADQPARVQGVGLMVPFAGSDFWVADLGLEFLHWPQQKILRKEVHRSQSCNVLESVQPNAPAGSYSRVVSWIDIDTGGIVDAYAYDANGKEFKHFYPRSFQKIEGRYELKRIEITNKATDSVTTLNFDPPPKSNAE